MKYNINKKKYLVALAALAGIQCATASPLEKLENSWYVGGAIGQSQLEPYGRSNWDVSDNKDISKKIYGGINLGRDFGLEGFWSDFGSAELTSNKSGDKANVKYRAYGANLVYHVPTYLGAIHPIVKLGVAKVDTEGEGVAVNQKNKFDIMAGIGAEYDLGSGFRIRAEYERFDEDISQVGIGLNWRPVLEQPPVQVVSKPEPQRPIIIYNQAPTPQPAPQPIVKTVVKHVPVVVKTLAPAPIIKTVVKHIPAPPPKPQPKVIHKTLAGGSNFATNSAALTGTGQNALNRMANDIIRNQVVIHNIAIIGHTDNVGSHAANQRLSQQRAATVANYLASRGLNRGLMTVVGRGETQPIANNATAAGRAKNRRVKLVVKGSQTITR